MPILNEELHRLCKAKCFLLVDVREGFLHIPLDQESSLMTTMHTSYGRYRWLRLPFGISSAPEEFQMRIHNALEDLEGTICIADDILVFGEGDTYDEAETDHDRRFAALMERCARKNIKLNPDKLQFKLKEVKFMGNLITDKGMRADPEKISAISNMTQPHDKAGILRFIGMVNYLSPFCQNLSATIQPLRMLTREGVPFSWSSSQDTAFIKAKRLIASAPVLRYYDLQQPVTLQVDASDVGLGGALLQPNKNGVLQPVAFTSCSLNDTERRYSQIEKECLAICNGFQKFDQWLYGKKDIEVHTDHKPLEAIMKKPLHKAPARLQKMIMTLHRYTYKLLYKKGTSLYIADTLSRAALQKPVGAKVTGFEVYRLELETLSNESNPRLTEETEKQLQLETARDPILNNLYKVITNGWPDDKQQLLSALLPYWNFRDELTINNGLIYKGPLTVIPMSMHAEMLHKIHSNHFGAESSIRMAKQVLFWPGMGKAIRDMCDSCATCAQYGQSAPKEPMKSLPIPTLPWQVLSQDLFELNKQAYLVTVCHFSDWVEVDKLDDMLAKTVVQKTREHFARYGIPRLCHSDNGPQFISKEYQDFVKEYGFRHTTSSPYHPKGNGRAEAAVKVIKSMLKKSVNLQTALLNYRNTPPRGHTYTPAQRLLCRHIRTQLPTADCLLIPQVPNLMTVQKEIMDKRSSSKAYYDKSAGPEHSVINVGDYVYAKPAPNLRGQPWAYGKIVGKLNPRSYTLSTDRGTIIRRNRVQVRPAAPPPPCSRKPQLYLPITVQGHCHTTGPGPNAKSDVPHSVPKEPTSENVGSFSPNPETAISTQPEAIRLAPSGTAASKLGGV